MTDDAQPDDDQRAVRAAAQRRRRRAEVFGDVLPESTRDDRDAGAERAGGDADAWLKANVPPHHG